MIKCSLEDALLWAQNHGAEAASENTKTPLPKRQRLYKQLGVMLGLDPESDEVREGRFSLPTSRNGERVLRELNLYSGAEQLFVDKSSKSDGVPPPGLAEEDVVCDLKIGDAAHGVDVLKMLRARQFLQPARQFSVAALKRKKKRWLKRARCRGCLYTHERCDACTRRRLAESVVMACAGHGLCDCKKGPVGAAELENVWVVQHKHKLWRIKRCTAVAGHYHDVHRDKNATFTFLNAASIDYDCGGRVKVHCHSHIHAGSDAAPSTAALVKEQHSIQSQPPGANPVAPGPLLGKN